MAGQLDVAIVVSTLMFMSIYVSGVPKSYLQEMVLNELSRTKDQKRTDTFSLEESLPWSCETDPVWTDLGQYHHPRHIRESRCINTTCYYGHYRCVPETYNVKVLVPNTDGYVDGKLPPSLRANWSFQEVPVTVGCKCQR